MSNIHILKQLLQGTILAELYDHWKRFRCIYYYIKDHFERAIIIYFTTPGLER